MNIKDKTVLVTGANRGIGRWQPKPRPEAPGGYTSAPARGRRGPSRDQDQSSCARAGPPPDRRHAREYHHAAGAAHR